MRTAFLFTLLAAASFSVAAQQADRPSGNQQQATRSGQNVQNADEKAAHDDTSRERTRVEGAAGGTRPEPAEKRRAVGAGAGPHLRDNLPSPQKLPRDEPVEPSK